MHKTAVPQSGMFRYYLICIAVQKKMFPISFFINIIKTNKIVSEYFKNKNVEKRYNFTSPEASNINAFRLVHTASNYNCDMHWKVHLS